MVITHDPDEAVYMSDRICMMTNGPRARVGQILEIPFERPRDRLEMLNQDLYYDLRVCLIDFLEKFDKHKHVNVEDDSDQIFIEEKPISPQLSVSKLA